MEDRAQPARLWVQQPQQGVLFTAQPKKKPSYLLAGFSSRGFHHLMCSSRLSLVNETSGYPSLAPGEGSESALGPAEPLAGRVLVEQGWFGRGQAGSLAQASW